MLMVLGGPSIEHFDRQNAYSRDGDEENKLKKKQ